jgi:hypothetical protein
MPTPEICPNCGADVPPNAKACPECGSCEETGWSESAATDGLGLPDEEFDYDDFVAREFGEGKPKQRSGFRLWLIVGVLLLAAFLILLLAHK